jgi:hypothetical protein
MSTWQILDSLLSPTNFPHKHDRAILSLYAQIRAGKFGRQRRTEEDNWFSKGLIYVQCTLQIAHCPELHCTLCSDSLLNRIFLYVSLNSSGHSSTSRSLMAGSLYTLRDASAVVVFPPLPPEVAILKAMPESLHV